jgi:hypothetical protein
VNWVLFFEAYDLTACENLLQQSAIQEALEQHGVIIESQSSYRLLSTFESEVG